MSKEDKPFWLLSTCNSTSEDSPLANMVIVKLSVKEVESLEAKLGLVRAMGDLDMELRRVEFRHNSVQWLSDVDAKPDKAGREQFDRLTRMLEAESHVGDGWLILDSDPNGSDGLLLGDYDASVELDSMLLYPDGDMVFEATSKYDSDRVESRLVPLAELKKRLVEVKAGV